MSGQWMRVCGQDELGRRAVRTVASLIVEIAVFHLEDGRMVAIEDRCPHRGAPLSSGAVYDGDKVACFDHGWTIRLTDGRVEPPEQGCVRTFPVKVEAGSVFVLVPVPGQHA